MATRHRPSPPEYRPYRDASARQLYKDITWFQIRFAFAAWLYKIAFWAVTIVATLAVLVAVLVALFFLSRGHTPPPPVP